MHLTYELYFGGGGRGGEDESTRPPGLTAMFKETSVIPLSAQSNKVLYSLFEHVFLWENDGIVYGESNTVSVQN